MSNIIEVKNLVKNYKDVHAVNDISFTVEEGSFFAFLGINLMARYGRITPIKPRIIFSRRERILRIFISTR